MKFSKKQVLIIGGVFIFIIVLLIVVFSNLRQNGPVLPPANLLMWGFDDKPVFDKAIESYQKSRTGIKVKYQKVSETNYDSLLIDALAAGTGPDIFMVGNRSVARQKNKMQPAAATQYLLTQLRSDFPQVVEQDFVQDGRIWALPLYIDTLSLLYNKDFFDQAGIVYPPKTWDEFQSDVAALRKVESGDRIKIAGAAIGGSEKTIPGAVDLLNLLMVQNGTEMLDQKGYAAVFSDGGKNGKGMAAFNFYLSFANPYSQFYTWSDTQPNAIDSFSSEGTAMIFGYQSTFNLVKNKNPFLNFAAAAAPQPTGAERSVAYANYRGLTVSKQSRAPAAAWDFIIYLATTPAVSHDYLSGTNRSPALKSIIDEKKNDPDIGVFARQALIARSWAQADDRQIKNIFSGAIANVLMGQTDSLKALSQAQDQINAVMKAARLGS